MIKDQDEYICLANNEGQYSLWFAWKEFPVSWTRVGPQGSKEECLQYIKEVWTDMRPRSLIEKMDKQIHLE